MFERFYLRGIGGIEHVQSWKVSYPAERDAQDFGTKTGSTHAQQQHVLESTGLDFFRDF